MTLKRGGVHFKSLAALHTLAEIHLCMCIFVKSIIVTFIMPIKSTKVTRPSFPHEREGSGDKTRCALSNSVSKVIQKNCAWREDLRIRLSIRQKL